MQQSRFLIFSLLLLLFLMLISCDTEDPFRVEPPDLSTVPQPYDTSTVESVQLSEGVKAYIHDEGHGPFEVTLRDQISVFLTLRTESGEIIYSTFSSERVDPLSITMSTVDGENTGIHQTVNQTPHNYTILVAYTPGFAEGLLGMRTGEKRTLVVSPEKGYENIPKNVVNQEHAESTLIYDVRISNISPTKNR